MSEYKEGKPYRETLRARPRQTSTPATQEVGGFPVHHRGGLAMNHKETVGHVPGGAYVEPTHPNAERMLHGASGTHAQREMARHNQPLDAEPMRRGPTSLK
jgi:hypothetical protein